MEKKIKSQTKIEKDGMETEDHLRKEDKPGRAKCNYLKGATKCITENTDCLMLHGI
ncbi:unnamed protein product [Gulo gulo]|uniref:Uncharacterized protein n=1 Tax=Gulo gulo TaxID=48420 RepID=A0A9X9Q3K8_GULGU|nr:unnamed protein product [Gulo gulo]